MLKLQHTEMLYARASAEKFPGGGGATENNKTKK